MYIIVDLIVLFYLNVELKIKYICFILMVVLILKCFFSINSILVNFKTLNSDKDTLIHYSLREGKV